MSLNSAQHPFTRRPSPSPSLYSLPSTVVSSTSSLSAPVSNEQLENRYRFSDNEQFERPSSSPPSAVQFYPQPEAPGQRHPQRLTMPNLKMTTLLHIQVISGIKLTGARPYIIVCFDRDNDNQQYKTASTPGGDVTTWNETFTIDYSAEERRASRKSSRTLTYLTFDVYDNAANGGAPTGSTAVLLSSLLQAGSIEGSFPIVGGTGVLHLSIQVQQVKPWYRSKKAKTVSTVSALGFGALALGLSMRHFHRKKAQSKSRLTGMPH